MTSEKCEEGECKHYSNAYKSSLEEHLYLKMGYFDDDN